MQELILSALVGYQLNKDPEILTGPPMERTFALAEIQKQSPTRHMNRKIYRGRGLQTSAFRSKQNRIVLTKPKVETPKANVRKTLIIAPHPDDEIICCSELMRERIEDGEKVNVIYLTDGDALEKKAFDRSKAYGRTRRKESIRAMQVLDTLQDKLAFLNFPDGHLSDLGTKPLASEYTKQSKSMSATHFNRSDYTLPKLKANVRRLLLKYDPDEIYLPSETKDKHPDHRAASNIVKNLLDNTSELQADVFEYIIHNHDHRKANLGKVNKGKLNLLRIFKSQFHDQAHKEFMESFARIPEIFTRVMGADIAKSE